MDEIDVGSVEICVNLLEKNMVKNRNEEKINELEKRDWKRERKDANLKKENKGKEKGNIQMTRIKKIHLFTSVF